jgi:hypothetical protein
MNGPDPGSRRPSEARLLRGYGPLVGMIVAFLAMALLAPTLAPTERVASGGSTGNSRTNGPAGLGEAGGDDGSGGPDQAGVDDGGGGQDAPGVSACDGLQVPNDPYSPPCASWGGGDNGGATSLGVTADTITLALRDTGGPYDIGAVISDLTGSAAGPPVTRADWLRTYEHLVEYFNRNFEFYGRKLEVKVYEGTGSLAGEILGGGQAQANADAIRAAQEVRAFADVSAEAPVYAEALARQGVVSTNPVYPSRQWYEQQAPFAYGRFPDCTKVVDYVAEFVRKSLAGRPVIAGQYEGQQRRYGLVYPSVPVYQQCGDRIRAALAEAGTPVTDFKQYTLSLDGIAADAGPIASQFANRGITSVLLVSDPIMPYFMTTNATQIGWFPEWINTGIAYMDADFAGQLMDKAQWNNSFGISLTGPAEPVRASFGYRAYQSIDTSTTPSPLLVAPLYYQLYLLAVGIQNAGPNLTPQSFGDGLRRYQSPGSGALGTWGMPSGDFTVPQDARIIWWDPNATSAYNNARGAYQGTEQRYRLGQLPDGPPPVNLTR